MSEMSPRQRHILKESGKVLALGALLVVLMLWLAGTFAGRVEPGPPEPRAKSPPQETQRVEQKSYPLLVAQTGTVQMRTQARVSSRITAQVRETLVHAGDQVTGQDGEQPATVLARLDDREIKARVQSGEAAVAAMERGLTSAQAQLAIARAQLEGAQARQTQTLADWHRYEDLFKKQAATGQQLDHARAAKDEADAQVRAAKEQVSAAQDGVDKAKAQKKQSEAALEEARVMLTYTTIEAPFGGVVARRMVDVGDMAAPGQALFMLETPAEPELHAVVAESLVPHLQLGALLQVHIDALGLAIDGTIRDIVRQADAQTRTVTVKVSLPAHPGLVSGMSGHVNVEAGTYEALVIPQSAVREAGQLYLVDVVTKEGYTQRRFVRLGQRHGDLVEVLAGLRANEEVVMP